MAYCVKVSEALDPLHGRDDEKRSKQSRSAEFGE